MMISKKENTRKEGKVLENKDNNKDINNEEIEKNEEIENGGKNAVSNEEDLGNKQEAKMKPEVDIDVTKTAEYEELDDRYKRLFAEFENYKKRSQKERDSIYGMITADVVTTMLPIMDNLEKAAEAKTDDEKYQEGIRLVARQFSEALKRLGLEEIEAVGKRFDPEFHEAVSHVEDDTKGEQEIVEEYRKGYKIGNKVVRHSMVIVAN